VPAPAVIPALIAYVKVVAVKTLVVSIRPSEACPGHLGSLASQHALLSGWGCFREAPWELGLGGRWSIVPSFLHLLVKDREKGKEGSPFSPPPPLIKGDHVGLGAIYHD